MIVSYPNNTQEKTAIKAILKALNIRYEVKADLVSKENKILKNIKKGLKEVDLFKKGQLKTSSAKDFLNEL